MSMNNLQNIIDLIDKDKKKSGSYDRYPVRFLYMHLTSKIEDDIDCLVQELNKRHFTVQEDIYNDLIVINLFDLLPFEDGWITKSNLFNFIYNLDSNKDYLILGFSELARFYSKSDLESLITSFMTNVESNVKKSKQRIYFLCFSLFDKISMELQLNCRNESINPIISDGSFQTENDNILVYYASSEYDKYFKNKISTTKKWLSLYKTNCLDLSKGIICISDTLISLYEKAKPDNFVSIEKLDSYFKLLVHIYKFNLFTACENDFSKDFWSELFEYCFSQNIFNLKEIIKVKFNVQNLSDSNVLIIFNKSNLFEKTVIHLFLIEYCSEFEYGDYLNNIFSKIKHNKYLNLSKTILCNFTILDINNINYLKARAFFIKQIDIGTLNLYVNEYMSTINTAIINFLRSKIFNISIDEKIDLFNFCIEDFLNTYQVDKQYFLNMMRDLFARFLSHILVSELIEDKIAIISMIQNQLIYLEDIKKIYPELIEYLGNENSFNISNSLQWASKYLYEYKLSKIMNLPSEHLNANLLECSDDIFYTWHNDTNLHYALEIVNSSQYDICIVLDGVGAEYLDFLVYLAKKNHKKVLFSNVAKCFLPSITSVNKKHYDGKYDEWINEFDTEIIHGTYYDAKKTLPLELKKLEDIFCKVIAKYCNKRILFFSDHGSTAIGKITKNKKVYSFDSNHEGRCALIKQSEFCTFQSCNDFLQYQSDDGSKWLLSLKDISLNDNPKREAHGGCSREEVLIPVIIIGNAEESITDFEIILKSGILSGLNRKVEIEILPHSNKTPILEEASGKRHIMKLKDGYTWVSEMQDIKSQIIKIYVESSYKEIEIKSSIGINLIKGDGFDD